MTSATYKCSRCSGLGRINVFSNVLGGVCFQCGGSGLQKTKPAAPSLLWAVFGFDRKTADLARLYNVKAPDAEKAITKAELTFEKKASSEYRNSYSMDSCFAVPAADADKMK